MFTIQPMKMNKNFLDLAVRTALSNPIDDLPKMAAILVAGNSYLFYGLNRRKTHPIMAQFGKHEEAVCLHAEIDAIVNATRNGIKDFSKFDLYVARVNKMSEPVLAKPCKGCQRAIAHFNIRNCYWTV